MDDSWDDMHAPEIPRPSIPDPGAEITRTSPSEREASPVAPTQTVKSIKGKCHPYNTMGAWIHDPPRQRAFIYGGIRKGDDRMQGTSDFSCLNTKTMKWTDLTNSLTYDMNYPLKTDEDCKPGRPLPRLRHPGTALVYFGESSFIYLFGGYDCDKHEATGNFVVIDIALLTWFYLKLDPTAQAVAPRIDLSLVFTGYKIYIFGGYRRFEPPEDCLPHQSFNVLGYSTATKTWAWEIQDRPYTHPVPDGHTIGQAIPLYGGKKILLAPGSLAINNPINFTQGKLFFYHTANDSFQPATVGFGGVFLRHIYWYSMDRYSEDQRSVPPIAAPSRSSLRAPSSETVVITAWIPFPKDTPDGPDAIPDIWYLVMAPEDSIMCLNIRKKVWDLNREFKGALLVDGKMRIKGTMPVDFIGDEIDDDDYDDPRPTWNRFIEVSVDEGHLVS